MAPAAPGSRWGRESRDASGRTAMSGRERADEAPGPGSRGVGRSGTAPQRGVAATRRFRAPVAGPAHNAGMDGPFSLDPRVDRARFLAMARDAAALAADWIDGETEAPVLRRAGGAALRERLARPRPDAPGDWEALLAELRADVVPHLRRNGHPGFFGYVSASAEPVAALADLLASAFNQNVTAWRSAPAAVELERTVVGWLADAVGYGGADGLLTSGGSAANLQGLAVALAHAGDAAPRESRVLYTSEETHLSLAKAARVLGIGHVRRVAVDGGLRLRSDALAQAVAADRAAGLAPLAVAASAGTTNTGAIDPLAEIAEVAAREKLWLHVDGAYGAPALMLPRYADVRAALARADSVSLDPHKWCFAPIDAGCLLARQRGALGEAFAADADYVRVEQEGDAEGFAFFDRGIELSRRFRALKLWLVLRLVGFDRLTEAIGRNIALREHLDARIEAAPDLESLGSGLSVSCFRYRAADPDAVNRRILERVLESGRFLLSPTRVRGAFALRVCIVNFRTREVDVDALVELVRAAGRESQSPNG